MQKYKAYEYTGDTLIYDPREVDAEIARLKADNQSYREVMNQAQRTTLALEAEANLLKAALRWCLENGATLLSPGGIMSDHGCGCCSCDLKPPPEFAAVIAEAVGSEQTQREGVRG